MSRYINVDKAIDAISTYKDQKFFEDRDMYIKRVLNDMPSVDVEPIRHGHWILCQPKSLRLDRRDSLFECSVCRMNRIRRTGEVLNYCPNCGAKMDGEEQENDD